MTPELPEARDVGSVEVLRVLDAPAKILLVGVRLERLLEDVQGFAIRAIADGVDAQLIAVGDREPRCLANRIHRGRVQPRAFRLVGVGFEQPRATRPERAVDLTLDGSHGEVAGAVVDRPVLRETWGLRLVALPHHDPEPHPHGAFVHHLLHQVDRSERRSSVLKAGDPFGERFAIRELQDLTVARELVGRAQCRFL